jgi:hypothetical protein
MKFYLLWAKGIFKLFEEYNLFTDAVDLKMM